MKNSLSKGNLSRSVHEEPPIGDDYGTYNNEGVRTPGKNRNGVLSRTHSESHVKHRTVAFKNATPVLHSPHD